MHEPTESDMSRESMMSYYHGALSSSFYISSCREAEGPAAKSLEFPSPALLPCQRGNTIRVLDTESRKCFVLDHVIIVSHSDHAYQLRGKLARSTYGVVRLGVVLKRRSELDRSKEYEDTDWEFSDQLVAIKVGVGCDHLEISSIQFEATYTLIHRCHLGYASASNESIILMIL